MAFFTIAAIVLTFIVGFVLYRRMNPPKSRPFKKDWKPGMVYMYQVGRASCVPSLSPFALKLETWLRMADIDYKNAEFDSPLNSVSSKEGTIPFVEMDGIEYDDSSLIVRDLTKLKQKEHLEEHLTEGQRAVGRAMEHIIENLFWSYAYFRFTPENVAGFFEEFLTGFEKTPKWMKTLRPVLQVVMRRFIYHKLSQHSIGKHSEQEIGNIGKGDVEALSNFLGDKAFLLGDKPTRADATMFGALAQILYTPTKSPQKELLKAKCPNLEKFCERMKQLYWPDWDEICKKRLMNTEWKKYR